MNNDRKNIVILMSALGFGGAERVAVSYANWLVENTDNNIYILKFDNKKSAYELNKKVNVISLTDKLSNNRIKAVYQRYKFCKLNFKKIKADIIFAMFYQTQLYAYFAKPLKATLIGSERCNILERSNSGRLLSKFASILCKGFIFQTNGIQKLFPKNVRKKSIVIPNAISNPKVYELTNINKKKVITAMGRLDKQKGFDTLIKAFSKVNNKHQDYILKIFGEGEEREYLQQLIDKLKLTDKAFLCGSSNEAINEVANSNIFVLSSRYEGMPNALIEAMSTGTACISTDCNFGPSDLIENDANGISVPVDNIELLEEKINYLIENNEARKTLEKNAVTLKERLDKNSIYKRYFKYFDDVYNKKTKFQKLIDAIKNPKYLLHVCAERGYFDKMSDKLYLKILYWIKFDKKLDLKNPKTFNEKLQWLKLYNRNPLYTTLVDKYEVRGYIKENLGEDYLIPLIGVYDNFDDIDFSKLPNQFVIKCNHDSGGLMICKNKKQFNIDEARMKINLSLKRNYYYSGREWPYKNIKPKIIIEKYMEDKNGLLPDYKFYCFNGKCEYVMVCTERETGNPKFYYFNKKWELIKNMSNDGIKVKENFKITKPKNIDKMFKIASELSKDIPFVRIDLYNVDGKIYFGEFTFYPSAGFDNTRRKEAEQIFSDMLGDVLK